MADPTIKPDPDAMGASPAAFTEEDEDIYEDAGDLEFNTDPAFQKLYLARVPTFVWEAFSSFDDNDEIRIGTVRESNFKDERGRPQTSLSILLSSDLAQHQPIPKEYALDITQAQVQNTFVFTEQDLPGFKSKSRAKFDLSSANMPSRLTRPKNDKPAIKKPYDANKRFEPYYRKAIPKRTRIAGKIAHEVNCVAVDNEDSRRIISQRTIEAMKPKARTKIVRGKTTGADYIQPGTLQAQTVFDDFIQTQSGQPKKRSQQLKTTRLPENELKDKLFQAFREFKYWPMKALRARLQQPEAYLKEILQQIAVLQKSGTFSNNWTLTPQNRVENYGTEDDAAAPPGEDSDNDDDDDDADIKFEDVA